MNSNVTVKELFNDVVSTKKIKRQKEWKMIAMTAITKIMTGLYPTTMRKRTRMRRTTRILLDMDIDNEDEMVDIKEPTENKTTDTNTNTNLILIQEDDDKDDDDENENNNENNVDVDDIPIQQILPNIPITPAIHTASKLLKAVYDNPECAICLEAFESDDNIIFCSNSIIPHCFHQECSFNYLCSHTKGVQAPCPLCRKPFLLCCSSTSQ